MQPKYEVELFSRSGVLIADISRYVKNLSFSMQRNEAEQLSFTINLDAFESNADAVGSNPLGMLGPYQTDIKIKRNGTYLFGAHVGYLTTNLGEIENTIEIRAFGYLNLLIDRFVTKTYTATDGVDIAWDLINETQTQDNGDMGMTQDAQQTTSPPRDRTYVRQNVKEAVLGLGILENSFDVKFTPDREFQTYAMLGSDQSATLEFVYPGNIVAVEVPRDGLSLFNKIYGLGSGFGDEALTSTQRDEDSQLNYGVHERISTYNSIKDATELDETTLNELDFRKDLLEIPQMTVSGEDFDLDLYGVGDRVTVRVDGHPFLATINGVYRIEKIDVTVDENESETIRLSFDNLDVEQ